MAGIGSHTKPNSGATDDWITPRYIIDDLGPFDLDPCCCDPQPWPCADKSYSLLENGLTQEWEGRVWLNPPYGRQTTVWLQRLTAHGNGIALIFARTETEMFVTNVWRAAHAVMFLWGRLYFHLPDGTRAKGNAGGPSCLVAYGQENADRLAMSSLEGSLVRVNPADRIEFGDTRGASQTAVLRERGMAWTNSELIAVSLAMQQDREYAANVGIRCPVCETNSLDYERFNVFDAVAWCRECQTGLQQGKGEKAARK